MFLFDTDYLSILKRQTGVEYKNLASRLSGHAEDEFFISIVSFHEQIRGWNAYLSRGKDQAAIVRGYKQR